MATWKQDDSDEKCFSSSLCPEQRDGTSADYVNDGVVLTLVTRSRDGTNRREIWNYYLSDYLILSKNYCTCNKQND